jgi:hypothetical protein
VYCLHYECQSSIICTTRQFLHFLVVVQKINRSHMLLSWWQMFEVTHCDTSHGVVSMHEMYSTSKLHSSRPSNSLIWLLWGNLLGQALWSLKISRKSPSSLTPYPLFQGYLQNKEILLDLSMKCWNSAFNAQGLRIIIVVVQVGVVKICVATVEALRQKEKRGWIISVHHQNWWKI